MFLYVKWLKPATSIFLLELLLPCNSKWLVFLYFPANSDSKGPPVTIIHVEKYIFGGCTSLLWSKWHDQIHLITGNASSSYESVMVILHSSHERVLRRVKRKDLQYGLERLSSKKIQHRALPYTFMMCYLYAVCTVFFAHLKRFWEISGRKTLTRKTMSISMLIC